MASINTNVNLLFNAKGVAQVQGAVRGIGDSVQSLGRQSFGAMRNFHNAINGFSELGKLAGGYFGLQGIQQFTAGVIELEKAMLSVKANIMSGAGSTSELNAQLKEIRDTAREISKTTIFNDAQSVNMVNALLKAGVSMDAAKGKMGAASGVAALSQLSNMSPDEAAAQVGSLGSAFGLKTGRDYYGLADHISKVDDAGSLDARSLLYNAKQVSATAAQVGVDPKRMISAIGYLSPLGDQAGTSLNRLFSGLAGTTKPKREAMAESGMQFWETDKNGNEKLKDLGVVLDIIRNKFSSMKSDKEKLQLSSELFGEEGARAAGFFSSKPQSFSDFEAGIDGMSGAGAKLGVAMEGLGAQFDRFKNTTFAAFADSKGIKAISGAAAGGLGFLSDAIDSGYGAEMLTGGLGALFAARVGWKKYKNRGGRAGGADDGGLLSGMGGLGGLGTAKVFVVNWPGAMGGLGGGNPAGGGRIIDPKTGRPFELPPAGGPTSPVGGKGGRLGRAFRGAGGWGGVGAAGAFAAIGGAYDMYDTYSNDSLTKEQKTAGYKSAAYTTVGSTVGGVAGGALGALLGGVGAPIGAMIGASAGRAIGEWLAKEDPNKVAESEDNAEMKRLLRQQEQTQRQQLAALQAIANKPTQVTIDGRMVAQTVNATNGSDARRF